MPLIESFEEFKQRQNCEVIKIKDGDFEEAWLFANGAACVQQKLMQNQPLDCHEPPQEKFALLRAQRLFVATKLGREAADYEAALADYKEQSSNAARYPHHCPPLPAGAMDSLRAGWDFIESLRQELEKIDAQLANSPEAILAR